MDELTKKLVQTCSIDAVLTSDLERARIPAERIAEYLLREKGMNTPLIISEVFRERDVGVFSGMGLNEFKAAYPGKHPQSYIFGLDEIINGEPKAKVYERIESAKTGYFDTYAPDSTIVILGHLWWFNYCRNYMLREYSRPYNEIPNLGRLVLEYNKKCLKSAI